MAPHILIIDDEADTLRLIGMVLKREGYDTTTAQSGSEGLQLAVKVSPDLIILDIIMPDMDGYAVAKSLRSNPTTAGIPILVFSARGQSPAHAAEYKSDIDDYLIKPVHPTELVTRIKALISRSKASKNPARKKTLIGFISASDNYNSSIVALNTAIGLNKVTNQRISAIELKPGIGSWHIELGLQNVEGLAQLFKLRPTEITPALLRNKYIVTDFGVDLLPSLSSFLDVENKRYEGHITQLLQNSMQLNQSVLVDMSSTLLFDMINILQSFTDLYIVFEPNPVSVYKTAELIDFFDNYAIKKDKRLELIINNHGVNEGLYPLYNIQKELQYQVNNSLPSSPNLVLQSSLTRTPLAIAYPNSEITKAYLKLAQYIQQRI